MKEKKKYKLYLLLILVSFFILTLCIYIKRHSTDRPVISDFRLESLNNERFYLNRKKGKVVVLIFWATWCNICKQEMMDMIPVSESFIKEKVFFAAVCTNPESIDPDDEIVKKVNNNYPILLDKNSNIFNKFKLSQYPSTVIINAKGQIESIQVGYDKKIYKQIINNIDKLF